MCDPCGIGKNCEWTPEFPYDAGIELTLSDLRRQFLDFEKKCGMDIARKMVTEDGFKANIDKFLPKIKNLVDGGYRVSLIYSDGRLFFDSFLPLDCHSGTRVYDNKFMIDNTLGGDKGDIPQLAIENHMARMEILYARDAAFNNASGDCDLYMQYPIIKSLNSEGYYVSFRRSSTIDLPTAYMAKDYGSTFDANTVIVRISRPQMEAPK